MLYHPTVLYHVYNQSNQHQLLFRHANDYLRFLRKLRRQIIPLADILCYCLMPTHFHLLLLPKEIGCAALPVGVDSVDSSSQQQLHGAFRSLLSSYTRGFNRKYEGRGSLFRAKTKYKPAYSDFIPEAWEIKEDRPFTQFVPYLRLCFDYIHDNPTAAGLVNRSTDWSYSSAPDYAGLRAGTLCNYSLTERLLGITRIYPV